MDEHDPQITAKFKNISLGVNGFEVVKDVTETCIFCTSQEKSDLHERSVLDENQHTYSGVY